VLTTLNVTGKPAQFGRGVMNEVGGKLLTIFAANLAATLAEPEGAGAGALTGTAPAMTDGGAAAPSGTLAASAVAGAAAAQSPVADAPVDDLKLPARATASLHREGITTVGQLATMTEDELLAIDGIGPASVVDIKSKLTEHGLTLGLPPAAAAASSAPAAGAEPAVATAGTPAASGAAAASDALSAAGTAGTAAPSAGPAGAGAAGSATPHASAAREAAHQLEDDAINLLKVAGMPVLKRAIPVLAALAAVLLVGLRRKMRRRRRTG
jgi:hypothetical protein